MVHLHKNLPSLDFSSTSTPLHIRRLKKTCNSLQLCTMKKKRVKNPIIWSQERSKSYKCCFILLYKCCQLLCHFPSSSCLANAEKISMRQLFETKIFYNFLMQEKVEVRVARIFNTFGPRMHMNDGRVVSNFILQALQNESITVCL